MTAFHCPELHNNHAFALMRQRWFWSLASEGLGSPSVIAVGDVVRGVAAVAQSRSQRHAA